MKDVVGHRSPGSVSRRHALGAALAGASLPCWPAHAAVATPLRPAVLSLQAPERMVRLHADGDGALLAVSANGALWRVASGAWQRLGDGLDPASPVAAGFDRVVGRSGEGGLWVLESGRVSHAARPALAPRAGFLVLALGVIAVTAEREGRHHVVRLEPRRVRLERVRAQQGDGSARRASGPVRSLRRQQRRRRPRSRPGRPRCNALPLWRAR